MAFTIVSLLFKPFFAFLIFFRPWDERKDECSLPFYIGSINALVHVSCTSLDTKFLYLQFYYLLLATSE